MKKLTQALLWVLVFSVLSFEAAYGADTLWKSIEVDGTVWEVRVVSEVPLDGSFPNRALTAEVDAGVVTDLYVKRQGTSEVLNIPKAVGLVTLVQSSFRAPAAAASGLDPQVALPDSDIRGIAGIGYPLETSAFFSDFYVNSFVRGGVEGIDDAADRAEIYREVFIDMALQPDLADDPSRESRYQTMLDRALQLGSFSAALGSGAEIFEALRDPLGNDLIDFVDYQLAVQSLANEVGALLDLGLQLDTRGGPKPLSQLATGLSDSVGTVSALTAASARILLLQSMAHERGDLKLRLLEQMYGRLQSTGTVDAALLQGLALARQDLDEYVGEYYSQFLVLMVEATLDDPNGVLHLDKLATAVVKKLFNTTSKAAARAVMVWQLNWEVFQGIRRQADRGRTASLAATVHRDMFQASGLQHHRDAMHAGTHLDGDEAQAFLELYQMSWYLAARHYRDSLGVLNNRLSRLWGAGIDLFQGDVYSLQMEELSRSLDRAGMVTNRIASNSYLAVVASPFEGGEQANEHQWVAALVRDFAPALPTLIPPKLLGLCVTLPAQPGTAATVEGMNIRFQPNDCGDPAQTQAWECSPNDPDGLCGARVQLFWDDDLNPNNADCTQGRGPCPIGGAEDLHPARSPFVWNAGRDGLRERTVFIRAVLSGGDQKVGTYSPGSYRFIDPRFEADAWSVEGAVAFEGFRSDGDGIPEVGESIDVQLTLRNESGRDLTQVTVDRLRVSGDPGIALTDGEWSESQDPEVSYVIDGESLVPNASAGATVSLSFPLELWVGTLTEETTLDLSLWVEYLDATHPDRPDLRRVQEVGFSVPVSDGSAVRLLSCDSIDIQSTTDGDLVFESGERGGFGVRLCNAGSWAAREVRGVFRIPAPIGEWRDEDSPFPDIDPGRCEDSLDDYSLRAERHECGSATLILDVDLDGGAVQGLTCPIEITCAPYQSIQDEVGVGALEQGDPVIVSVGISNTGAAPLTITSTTLEGDASATEIIAAPTSLAAGEQSSIEISINTALLSPGGYERRLRVESNANNLDEREASVFFSIIGASTETQVTTQAISVSQPDISGDRAVYQRGSEIYLMNLGSGLEERLTETADREYKPRIDGSYVVYVRDDGDSANANVVLYDLDTGLETAITDLPAKQTEPDVHGQRIVWQDERNGETTADLYAYDIGVSSTNGSLLVDHGANVAVFDPRIDDGYIAWSKRTYSGPFSFDRDIAFRRESDGSIGSPGLLAVCDPGNLFDIFEHRLAVECECDDLCDRDDHIYYYDMSTGSGPHRLTCDSGLEDDREEPTFIGDEIVYKLDGDDDLYKVAVGGGCQNEVPLQIGPQMSQRPAGEPHTGAFVFLDNRTGQQQLWGVLPPPAVEVGIVGFDIDQVEIVQGDTPTLTAGVRNSGTDGVGPVTVSFRAGGVECGTAVTSALGSGDIEQVSSVCDTGGLAAGQQTFAAVLSPVPGDADPANDSASVTAEIVDDDLTPPVVLGPMIEAGAGSDGDPYLEAGEPIRVSWDATDPSGLAVNRATVEGVTLTGVMAVDGFEATFSGLAPGSYTATIDVIDGDDSPESTTQSRSFEVFPGAPEVVARVPGAGATAVDPLTLVTADFSVDLDENTVDSSTVRLVSVFDGSALSAVVAYGAPSRRVTLQPALVLLDLSVYRVELDGILDVRGNPLPEESWTFTTAGDDMPIFSDGFESGSVSAWSAVFP
ncbi:MAG: Ig-like domain-containing protein [Acidobacteriota bacterium]